MESSASRELPWPLLGDSSPDPSPSQGLEAGAWGFAKTLGMEVEPALLGSLGAVLPPALAGAGKGAGALQLCSQPAVTQVLPCLP